MKAFLKRVLSNPTIAGWIVDIALSWHNKAYWLVNHFSIFLERDGIHPKHRLMKYHDFFLDRITDDDIVFDIGCGNAALAYAIARKAKEVIGIDNNLTHIKEAEGLRKGQKNLTLLLGDATKYDFETLPTVIVLSNVLEHIYERDTFLRRLASLSNRFLIRVPTINRDWVTLYKKERGIEWHLDPTHFTEYTLELFKAEIAKANLTIVDYSIQFGEIWAECKLMKND